MITPLTHSWSRLLGVLLCATVMMCAVAPTITRAEDDADAATTDEAATDEAATDEAATEEAPADEAATDEAATEEAPADDGKKPYPNNVDNPNIDVLWTCLAAFLVFFMQAGFCLVEAGFTRAKNVCNIIMKNVMDFSVGTLAFWLVGFGLMFGATAGFETVAEDGTKITNGLIGTSGFFYEGITNFDWAFLIFQTVFCATAATIVSGAMAERTKFTGYLAYSLLITVIVYPIFGSWCWNGLVGSTGSGWLENIGFLDFAGSTVVHSIGGWCALAGAIVLGPRIGKFNKEGKAMPIPGHNIPLAALGVFILWLGWFGFNPGSTTSVDSNFAFIAVTTNLAAAAGAIGAMVTAWVLFGKPDPSFTLNGALAGLVGITAGCDCIPTHYAALTGLVAGVLCVFSVLAIDRLRIDDPVGAVSVHGVCGAWGTLAVGLFMEESGLLNGGGIGQTITQCIGIGAGFAWAFGVSFIIFSAIKYTIGLRVDKEEELEGLDIVEHGMYGYPPNMVSESYSSPTK